MQVKEIMNCNTRTVTPDTSMVDVVSYMCLYGYSGLPVLEEGKVVGFIAEKDVLHELFPSLSDLADMGMASVNYDEMMGNYKGVMPLTVKDLMSTGVVSVTPDMHILRAATVMVRHKFRRIPVVEGDTLMGMLSLGDVHKALYQNHFTSE